jgi:hypothetical protein
MQHLGEHHAAVGLYTHSHLTLFVLLTVPCSQQADAADEDDTSADNDTHTTHSRDQGDNEISAAADGDDSPSAAAAGDHISAHHLEISAEDADADPAAVYGLTAGGSHGSEVFAAEGDSAEQQDGGSYAGEHSVQQQTGEIEEEEEEYAPAEHDEAAKAEQVRVAAGCRTRLFSACLQDGAGQCAGMRLIYTECCLICCYYAVSTYQGPVVCMCMQFLRAGLPCSCWRHCRAALSVQLLHATSPSPFLPACCSLCPFALTSALLPPAPPHATTSQNNNVISML